MLLPFAGTRTPGMLQSGARPQRLLQSGALPQRLLQSGARPQRLLQSGALPQRLASATSRQWALRRTHPAAPRPRAQMELMDAEKRHVVKGLQHVHLASPPYIVRCAARGHGAHAA